MHAFDALGDPVRRRILELLSDGEQTSGALTSAIRAEFGISQPAISQHLRVLRESGLASVRAAGTRRLYALEPAPLREADAWLERFRGFWGQRSDALGTELARGSRERRLGRRHGGDAHDATTNAAISAATSAAISAAISVAADATVTLPGTQPTTDGPTRKNGQ
ncbi:ArsR/SmtB family transcription factor [Microbispora hainanensis]|uniref:ArsR/SmtB family transcription factor n=1 Tax=Microbispora hainanensis TaxID=568844 RepID=UPI0038640DFB